MSKATEGRWAHAIAQRDKLQAENTRLTAEVSRLTEQYDRDMSAANETMGEAWAEVAKLRQACEGLLKHAASKAFWEQQSVDHWDKPGPHNAAVKALKAIAVAEKTLGPATEGEGGEASPLGWCPVPGCGKRGASRERRLNGNDTCEAGHVYPSKDADTGRAGDR